MEQVFFTFAFAILIIHLYSAFSFYGLVYSSLWILGILEPDYIFQLESCRFLVNTITTYKFHAIRCSSLIVGFLYHSLGLTGSVVLRSGRLSDLISQLQELLKGVTDEELAPSPYKYDTAVLAAQVCTL